jgi:cysteine-rich repeat protein
MNFRARWISWPLALLACGDSGGGTEGPTGAETADTEDSGVPTTSAAGPATDSAPTGGMSDSDDESSTGDPVPCSGADECTTTTDPTTGPPGFCGDGVVGPGEQCDDGDADDADECTSACKQALCGDGILGPGEQCDDGNRDDDDGCTSACEQLSCGDGILGPGEECDDGNPDDTDECTSAWKFPCGDAILGPGEQCDDGNHQDGDSCSADCSFLCLVPVTHPTVQAGVDDAACPTVWVLPGTYTENVTVARDLVLEREGEGVVTIDGDAAASVFTVGQHVVTLRGLVITNGRAAVGGGIVNGLGDLTLEDTEVALNTATAVEAAAGGGICSMGGKVTLVSSSVHDNTVDGQNALGGGMSLQGTLLFVGGGSSISNNTATNMPGGVTLGGGMHLVESTASIVDSTVSFNENLGADGGGIVMFGGSLLLLRSTVAGNTVADPNGGRGGAIHALSALSVSIINSTLTGNGIPGFGNGAAISVVRQDPGITTLQLRNATITDNTIPGGFGGGFGASSSVGPGAIQIFIRNSILFGNTATAGPECFSNVPIMTEGYNLFGDLANCPVTPGVGDHVGEDPLLGTLMDNGGPTLTHALADDSPAIDAGDPAGCTDESDVPLATDQRGEARPAGDACDIGAFEVQL